MNPPFLAQFPDFRWDPTAPLLENFGRLADQEGWSKKSKTYKKMRRDFLAEGVLIGFLDAFGKNASSLQAWQSLCKTIGVLETEDGEGLSLLTSIKACKNVCFRTGVISPPSVFADVSCGLQALDGVYVNIVDLVDAGKAGHVISETFSSQKELADYIRETGKVFAKEEAKRNPLLSRFLIVVGSGTKSRRKLRPASSAISSWDWL